MGVHHVRLTNRYDGQDHWHQPPPLVGVDPARAELPDDHQDDHGHDHHRVDEPGHQSLRSEEGSTDSERCRRLRSYGNPQVGTSAPGWITGGSPAPTTSTRGWRRPYAPGHRDTGQNRPRPLLHCPPGPHGAGTVPDAAQKRAMGSTSAASQQAPSFSTWPCSPRPGPGPGPGPGSPPRSDEPRTRSTTARTRYKPGHCGQDQSPCPPPPPREHDQDTPVAPSPNQQRAQLTSKATQAVPILRPDRVTLPSAHRPEPHVCPCPARALPPGSLSPARAARPATSPVEPRALSWAAT
ncbi:hypothetical protein SALBM311S_09504 [Streptomyces alboniger]